MAQRQKMRLEKRRDPQSPDFGGYMLVSSEDTVILGARDEPPDFPYDATLDEVEAFLLDEKVDGLNKPERQFLEFVRIPFHGRYSLTIDCEKGEVWTVNVRGNDPPGLALVGRGWSFDEAWDALESLSDPEP
jgi:hypothetical protein